MMKNTTQNTFANFASKFINNTNRHVFLTGKAGTGKTTFLKHIIKHTYKNAAIVAPTGIAAINAGGVTIHSLFQIAPGTFIPSNDLNFRENTRINTPNILIKNLQMHGVKRKLIRELELLIIDEVSMLRADLLDAIDCVLRFVRRSSYPFGGLQVLFIGDLLQLPPVIKDDEWNLLRQYYKSAYFFEALALRDNKPLYIELDTIYRQKDNEFISLLNNFRNNTVNADNIQTLNRYFQPDFKPSKKQHYIHLTTHNHAADEINRKSLMELKEQVFNYKAEIEDEFPENMFPLDMNLQLKVGAQVMFIKNDSTGQQRFFNGKIATIEKLSKDEITVKFEDNNTMEVEKHMWENIKYAVNESTNEIETKVSGKFTQYPLKLAWAITIHKSQGLTFERAIIDVGNAFAPGQVYVALSRLTSLQGLVLTTRVNTDSLINDKTLEEYSNNKANEEQLEQELESSKSHYLYNYLLQSFNLQSLLSIFQMHVESYSKDEKKSPKQKLFSWAVDLKNEIAETKIISDKFMNQMATMIHQQEKGLLPLLLERVMKAKEFFSPILRRISSKMMGQVNEHRENKMMKSFLKELLEVDAAVYKQVQQIIKAETILLAMINDADLDIDSTELSASNEKRKQEIELLNKQIKQKRVVYLPSSGDNYDEPKTKKKKEKHDTKKESYDRFVAGKTITEIAADRNMAETTIEGHLAYYVALNEISATAFVSQEKIDDIRTVIREINSTKLTEIKEKLGEEYSYSDIRFAIASIGSNDA
jgi:hypothetical protein